MNINYTSKLDLIINFDTQLIVIDDEAFDTSIALLYIYNKKIRV